MSSVFDLSLNPIEEIIYAHESKSFTFNCGLLFDFDVLLDQEKLKKSILLLMERFPILSTCISFGAGPQRTKLSNININDLLVVTSTENFNEEDFTDKFNHYWLKLK